MEQDTEVLVVGAGPAGLAAAAELSANRYQVLLVEARERIGGRILTMRHPASPIPLDLGAEFVHGDSATAPQSWRIIERELLPIYDAWNQAEVRMSEGIHGVRAFRLLDGNIQIAHALIAGSGKVRCLHGSPVTEIRWEPGSAQVLIADPGGERRKLYTRAVVLAVPIGPLLKIHFKPGLPHEKIHAASEISMGAAIKVLIGFREAFWKSKGLFEHRFIHSADAEFSTWWNALPFRTRFLTGWAGGNGAASLSQISREELRERALRSLAKVTRIKTATVETLAETFLYHDWTNDPYSLGAYSQVAKGHASAPSRLRMPIENTLFFAGDAIGSHALPNTVEAAIESGVRAAQTLMAVDRPQFKRRAA